MPNQTWRMFAMTEGFTRSGKESDMGIDQKGSVVFRVASGANGRWDVWVNDFEDPLASFDSKQDACDYANKLTMAKEGATVVVDEDMPATSLQGKNMPPPSLP